MKSTSIRALGLLIIAALCSQMISAHRGFSPMQSDEINKQHPDYEKLNNHVETQKKYVQKNNPKPTSEAENKSASEKINDGIKKDIETVKAVAKPIVEKIESTGIKGTLENGTKIAKEAIAPIIKQIKSGAEKVVNSLMTTEARLDLDAIKQAEQESLALEGLETFKGTIDKSGIEIATEKTSQIAKTIVEKTSEIYNNTNIVRPVVNAIKNGVEKVSNAINPEAIKDATNDFLNQEGLETFEGTRSEITQKNEVQQEIDGYVINIANSAPKIEEQVPTTIEQYYDYEKLIDESYREPAKQSCINAKNIALGAATIAAGAAVYFIAKYIYNQYIKAENNQAVPEQLIKELNQAINTLEDAKKALEQVAQGQDNSKEKTAVEEAQKNLNAIVAKIETFKNKFAPSTLVFSVSEEKLKQSVQDGEFDKYIPQEQDAPVVPQIQ